MFFGFPSRYRLCELFGIPLYLDPSLAILLFFFVMGGGSLAAGLLCAVMLLVSITAHELGHALTARSFGCETSDITLSLLGGCASLIALPRKPVQEFLTAVAGPAVSFALSALGAALLAAIAEEGTVIDAFAYIVADTLDAFGVNVSYGNGLTVRHDWMFAASMLLYFALMNAMLAFFNLLPGFPLDGGRVFRSATGGFMSRARATYIAMVVGRIVAVAIGFKGAWSVLRGGNWGFVTLLIAWMIWKEGWREYQLSLAEGWRESRSWTARVSPPPYGGRGEDSPIEPSR